MPNLPSIVLEEVAPVTHSDAMLLAPEELQVSFIFSIFQFRNHLFRLYTKVKFRKTEKGLTERSKTDKKRERRLKKRFQHLHKEKIQASKDKLKSQSSRKKAGGIGKDSTAIKSSDKFFARLSERVKTEVEGKKLSKKIIDSASGKRAHKLRHLKL